MNRLDDIMNTDWWEIVRAKPPETLITEDMTMRSWISGREYSLFASFNGPITIRSLQKLHQKLVKKLNDEIWNQ